MNKFPVLVIGADVPGQLAPYAKGLQVEPYWTTEDGLEVRRTDNPDGIWDSWQVGGRWLVTTAYQQVDAAPVRLVDNVPPVYAIVHEGRWQSRDTMNWPGAEHTGTEVWISHVGRLMNTLPPDTMLTVVDAHI